MSRNLILGLAANYQLRQIEPFLASWHRHAPKATLALFQGNMDQPFYDLAARLGIILQDAVLHDMKYHAQTARFLLYKRFLAATAGSWDSVLITDVRDVIFQGDPFAVDLPNVVAFAAEDQVINRCVWNSGWIRQAYGDETLQAFDGKIISCSGTTIGRADGMMRYIDMILEEAERHPHVASVVGMDQGFHNYILRARVPGFVTLDDKNLFVATVGHTAPARISFSEGRVLVDRVASPVVHQWDRHPAIAEQICALYKFGEASEVDAP